MVATLVAGSAEGKVVSYEHYRYDAGALTAEMERSAAAILGSLRIKPPVASCPPEILALLKSNRGTCLEPAVFGETVVAACGRQFEGRRWIRDDATEAALGKQTGKKQVCYHPPAK
jgi:hypothetical protein